MNLTLSVDEAVVVRARAAAQAMGKSLNQLVREYLEGLAGRRDAEASIAELSRLRKLGQGDSRGQRIRREDAYDRTVIS